MYGRATTGELTRAEFDAARLGFLQTLRRKRMSPQFIERHADDLLAQAAFEYSRQVSEGKEIGNPVAWIITCGLHRTIGLLEARDWTPTFVSTERAGELVDHGEEPQEAFLEGDRQRKVREAVEQLPAYQRRLLALSYFEDESVREAGRRLGWTPSKAQRAHEAARRRLQKLLGVESSDELELEIGLAAFVSLAGDRATGVSLPAGIEAAVDHLTRGAGRAVDFVRHPFGTASEGANVVASQEGAKRIPELGRRLVGSGAAEAGAAAASDGGVRAIEVCKYVAACALGAGAITGAVIAPNQHRVSAQTERSHRAADTAASTSDAGVAPSYGTNASTGETSATSNSSEAPSSAGGASPSAESRAERRSNAQRTERQLANSQFSAATVAAGESEAGGSGSGTPSVEPAARGASSSAAGETSEETAAPAPLGGGEAQRKAAKQFRGPLG